MTVLENDPIINHFIWMDEKGIVQIVNQKKLPFKFEIYEAKTVNELLFAIKEMMIQGASFIGLATAYALVISASDYQGTNFRNFKELLISTVVKIKNIRSTTMGINNVQNRMLKCLKKNISIHDNTQLLKNEARNMAIENFSDNKKIGEFGNSLIPFKGSTIMTLCNSSKALSCLYFAKNIGKKFSVIVNETRPRLQGARITAWELSRAGIDHYIIADGAAGYYVREGNVDLAIVGSDRICLNGDVINKIGTYSLSLLCKEHNIPFYVAARKRTFNKKVENEMQFTIEERDASEIKTVLCVDNEKDENPKRRFILNSETPCLNPAFDITPAKNITGIITPSGILKQPLVESIKNYLEL